MQSSAGAVSGIAAPLGGTVKPESLWPDTHYLSKAASDFNVVDKLCMPMAGKLDQHGLANKLGPGRDRWQAEALQGGCLA